MTDTNRNSSKTWLYVLASCVGIFVMVLCVGAILIFSTRKLSTFIEPDERGLVLLLNEPTGEILEPGYHFILPNKQVVIYKISRQTYNMSANTTANGGADFVEGTTSDGQKIQIDISVIYAVDPQRIPDLYREWRNTYRDGCVRPMSRSITRDTMEAYTFNEIQKKRDEIEKIIFDELEGSLTGNYLILVEFDLLDVRRVDK